MSSILATIQTVLSIAVIVLILVQARGTGFGRGSASGASFTKRGLEKLIFKLTFVCVGILIAVSLLQFIV